MDHVPGSYVKSGPQKGAISRALDEGWKVHLVRVVQTLSVPLVRFNSWKASVGWLGVDPCDPHPVTCHRLGLPFLHFFFA